MKTSPGISQENIGPIPNQYIVVFKDQWQGRINKAVGRQVIEFVNARISEFGIANSMVKSRYEYALRGFTAKLTKEQLNALKKDKRVKYVEQDRRFKAFSSVSSPLPNLTFKKTPMIMSQTIPWGVTRVEGPLDGTGKKAWIIDTGIDQNHPDLNIDTYNSTSFVPGEGPDDVIGHGTYVAGILAAKDNSQDVVGVAAGATVVAVKVLHQNPYNNKVSEIVQGVNYVMGKASANDVVNMSLGGPQSSAMDDAVENAANTGLRFTIAAGNENQNANNVSPARVENPNVYTVSAFDDTDTFADFSNFGNPPIEYSEPGEDIPSLLIGGGSGLGFAGPGSEDGTSYAAPHLAGLLLAAPLGIATDGFVSNDPDGDADSIAVAQQDYPLSVYINGTHRIDPGVTDTWNAIVSNNEGSVSYQWYIQYPDDNNWYSFGNNSSVTTYFNNQSSTTKSAALKVNVSSAGESDSDTFNIQIYPACNSAATAGKDSVSTNRPAPCN